MQIYYLNGNYLWGNFQPSIQLTTTYRQLESSKINDLTVPLLTRKLKMYYDNVPSCPAFIR